MINITKQNIKKYNIPSNIYRTTSCQALKNNTLCKFAFDELTGICIPYFIAKIRIINGILKKDES